MEALRQSRGRPSVQETSVGCLMLKKVAALDSLATDLAFFLAERSHLALTDTARDSPPWNFAHTAGRKEGESAWCHHCLRFTSAASI